MEYQMVTSREVLWGSTVGYPSDSLASCLHHPRLDPISY